MKASHLLTILLVACPLMQAAPTIKASDVSGEALKDIATERQRASMDAYDKSVRDAEKRRDDAQKEAREITDRNDKGMKETIIKRHVNTMLPPCEREPEAPRVPDNYKIR